MRRDSRGRAPRATTPRLPAASHARAGTAGGDNDHRVVKANEALVAGQASGEVTRVATAVAAVAAANAAQDFTRKRKAEGGASPLSG